MSSRRIPETSKALSAGYMGTFFFVRLSSISMGSLPGLSGHFLLCLREAWLRDTDVRLLGLMHLIFDSRRLIFPHFPLWFKTGSNIPLRSATGLNVSADGKATFANTVGSYWVATGNIFIYIDDNSSDSKATNARDKNGPMVDAPLPVFAVTRNIVRNETGGNGSLSYSVAVKRAFSVKSSLYSWSQTLSFSNHGLLSQQGYSQVNRQLTTGNNTITELGDAPIPNSITFQYPLVVNATYGITSNEMTIDSWMMRGLDFESTGGLGISTYTLSSGPSYLHTSQSGPAQYKSVTGGSSISWGDTTNVFESQMDGQLYHRSVHAVNGTVVSDTDPEGKVSASSPQDYGDTGRGSVRSIIGKGPGALIN